MAYSNTIYSVFSFIGFLFCAIPFTWHLKNGNTGTCLSMAWAGISCLHEFINSVVWNGNAVNWSPVWCDISTRIFIGSGVGIPAASLCIFRRLYSIATAQGTIPTADKSVKRRRVMIDLAIGLGLPFIEIIFGYIVQGHRFNILEDIGCYPAIYNSPVSIALIGFPPVLIGLVTARYAVPTIIAFNRRRLEFNDLLAGNSNITSSFYLRLMCFAGSEVLCTIPLGSYFIYVNLHYGLNPWISWANTHSHFSYVGQYPSSFWQSDVALKASTEIARWIPVFSAFLFFVFFGFAEEARKNYRAAYLTVAKYIGLSTPPSKPSRDPPPMTKRKDIVPLAFAHTAGTDFSIPITDIEGHRSDENENEIHLSGEVFQGNTTFPNGSSNQGANNCHQYPISQTLPEHGATQSNTLTVV